MTRPLALVLRGPLLVTLGLAALGCEKKGVCTNDVTCSETIGGECQDRGVFHPIESDLKDKEPRDAAKQQCGRLGFPGCAGDGVCFKK